MADLIIESYSTRTSQTCCQNCGHSSHCGGPKYATIKDYAVDGGEYREIKICDHCRCDNCNKEREKQWQSNKITKEN